MERTRKIYLASSWRNEFQPQVLDRLRSEGHEVYDFRNPKPGEHGFAWSAIDPEWQRWTREAYLRALRDPIAEAGYANDFEAMEWADTCVLLLPSGRSAHIEAGYFAGHPDKELHILLAGTQESELMYKLADSISLDIFELFNALGRPGL